MAEIFFIRLNNATYVWKYVNRTPPIYLIYSLGKCKVLSDYLTSESMKNTSLLKESVGAGCESQPFS